MREAASGATMDAAKEIALPTYSLSVFHRSCMVASGAYGSVYLAETRHGGRYAVKVVKKDRIATSEEYDQEKARLWNEAVITSFLSHSNVVSFKFMVSGLPNGIPGMATEFVLHGSLSDAIEKRDNRVLTWSKVLAVAVQVAAGMAYLHSKGVVHFDLKSANILVDLSHPLLPICKVADFGLAMVKHTLSGLLPIGGKRGTLPYMAPEVVEADYSVEMPAVSEKVDVYSFGILMWELLVGEVPYKDLGNEEIERGVVGGVLRPAVPEWCEPSWKALMEECWSASERARPSFEEIYGRILGMIVARRTLIQRSMFTSSSPPELGMEEQSGSRLCASGLVT